MKTKSENYSFFTNKKCEFFPCHQGIPEDEFNCLFCYCPLYFVENCGGDWKMTKSGIKDCSDCLHPHLKNNYSEIIARLSEEIEKKSKRDP